MSYFDSIAQFSQAQSAIQDQAQQVQQEYKDKKAQGIEEKFDYVDKVMDQLGGGIGGLSGGIHLTRKIYKKIKTARSKVQEARQQARDKLSGRSENNTTNEDPPNSHNATANGEEDQPSNSQLKLKPDEAGQEVGGGTEKLDVPSGPEGAPKAPDEPTARVGDASGGDGGGGGGGAKRGLDQQEPTGEGGGAQPKPSEAKLDAPEPPTASKPAEGLSDLDKLTNEEAESLFKEPDVPVKSAPSAPADVPDIPEHLVGTDTVSSWKRGGGSLFGDKPAENPADLGGGAQPKPQAQADGGGGGGGAQPKPQAEGGSKATSGEAGAEPQTEEFRSILAPPDAPSGGLPDVIAQRGGAMSDTLNDARGVVSKVGSKITNGVDSIGSAVNDVKSSVGGAIKSAVGDDVLNVVSKAGEVLDILGPVGEVVGAGIALGSFFHNIFDKKKKEREEKEAEDKPMNITQSGGIDTTSMNLASVKSNVVGTLV